MVGGRRMARGGIVVMRMAMAATRLGRAVKMRAGRGIMKKKQSRSKGVM